MSGISLYSHEIKIQKSVNIHSVVPFNVIDILGALGGVLGLFITLVTPLVIPFAKYGFELSIAETLFTNEKTLIRFTFFDMILIKIRKLISCKCKSIRCCYNNNIKLQMYNISY